MRGRTMNDRQDQAPSGRPRLPDSIAGLLLQMLAERGLRAGDVLPAEAELARQFNVSKSVIREALNQLAGSGLIRIQQGRASSLDAPSWRPVAHMIGIAMRSRLPGRAEGFAVYALIVGEMAADAALHIDERGLAEFDLLASRLSATTDEDMVALELEAHALLGRYCGNVTLAAIAESLTIGVLRERPMASGVIAAAYRILSAALARRDPEGARRAVRGIAGLHP